MKQFKISLEAARVNAGFTQKKAAELLGIDRNTLRSWEKGITSPTWKKLNEIEELYKIDKDYIFLPYNLAKSVYLFWTKANRDRGRQSQVHMISQT